MGRTKRKRKSRQGNTGSVDLSDVLLLQKSMRLKCPNIKISRFSETGRGVKCKKKLNEGDILIALPLYKLITVDTHSDVFSLVRSNNQTPQFVLSVFLIYEAHLKTDSKYFNYIESSPKTYTNLFFCTEEEIELLPDLMRRPLLPQITRINQIIGQLFEILGEKKCIHCGEPLTCVYTRENFIWAWFTVNTRSVYYKDKRNVESLALAPLLDMFNHSNSARIEQYIDFEKELYVLKTLVEYKKHEEVFIKYGPHSNLKLLVEYGFILPDNPHDFIEFTFEEIVASVKETLCTFGEIPKFKYNFIKMNNLNRNLTKNEEFSWNCNGLMYVLVTSDENLSLMQSKTYSGSFDERENELIKKIGDVLRGRKLKELLECLSKMETVKNCTESFKLAKDLMKMYIALV